MWISLYSSHMSFIQSHLHLWTHTQKNWKLLFSSFSLFQVVQEVSKAGLSLKDNRTTDGFWKFTSSAVFAATVVTTIGQAKRTLLKTNNNQM